MDTWGSKPCSYLLSHLLLVFNDSLAIPTASFFFLFSTYSIIAGWAGFSRQLPLLLLLWDLKSFWLGQSVIGQMCSPVMVWVHLSDLLSQILHVMECGTCFPPWLHSLSWGATVIYRDQCSSSHTPFQGLCEDRLWHYFRTLLPLGCLWDCSIIGSLQLKTTGKVTVILTFFCLSLGFDL